MSRTASIPSPDSASPTRPEDQITEWAKKYRGATVADLDLPPALSVTPSTPIAHALMAAYEREYTHLTVTAGGHSRALLGYLSIPRLKELLKARAVDEAQGTVGHAMTRFKRKGRPYTVISTETPLEDLEAFFEGVGAAAGERQDFAVVTDAGRRFVLGVATREDLAEFVKRRPA